MTSILYLLAVPIAVVIKIMHIPSPSEVAIQVTGTGERGQKERIRIDQKEIEIDGSGTGATTAVIQIGIGTVGIGIRKAIRTEVEEERMTLITETAARKIEAEDTPLDQVVNVIAVIRAIIMVSDTATPRKKPTPLLVD
jgi:hypothetical protein